MHVLDCAQLALALTKLGLLLAAKAKEFPRTEFAMTSRLMENSFILEGRREG